MHEKLTHKVKYVLEKSAVKVKGSENMNRDREIRKSFQMKVTLSRLFEDRKYSSGQILRHSSVPLFILQIFPELTLQLLV